MQNNINRNRTFVFGRNICPRKNGGYRHQAGNVSLFVREREPNHASVVLNDAGFARAVLCYNSSNGWYRANGVAFLIAQLPEQLVKEIFCHRTVISFQLPQGSKKYGLIYAAKGFEVSVEKTNLRRGSHLVVLHLGENSLVILNSRRGRFIAEGAAHFLSTLSLHEIQEIVDFLYPQQIS